jgi:hypothetical protein
MEISSPDLTPPTATKRSLPRRRLGRGTTALLVLLRVYVIIAVPVVAYAFVHALGTAQ